jgi:hypothetical protein
MFSISMETRMAVSFLQQGKPTKKDGGMTTTYPTLGMRDVCRV